MLRALGAALIISGCTVWAMSALRRLKRRVSTLSELIASLQVMKSEICTRYTPVRDVFEELESGSGGGVRLFYSRVLRGMEKLGSATLWDIWREAAVSSTELGLTVEEREALSQLGASLGKYQVDEQSEAIGRTLRFFEQHLRKAEEERARDSRVHTVFPIAAGIFTVIILL